MDQRNQLRIIGGKWRGRKLSLAKEVATLRPTHDRIRETVFNWLAPMIVNACCADLFAGSGALGFEALSRGASLVYFVDEHPKVIEAIKTNAEKLQALDQTVITRISLPSTKLFSKQPFDIVFIDPPFRQNLILPTLTMLLNAAYLQQSSLIYIEAEKELSIQLPAGLIWHRHQVTATLQYGLLNLSNQLC